MIPLNFTAQFDAVEHKMVDFTFTDPSVYACLEREFLARPVVSLRKQSKVGDSIFQLDRFYGVFIVRSNSSIKEVAGNIQHPRILPVDLTAGFCLL